MLIADVARICHEANLQLCATLGDWDHDHWESAPEWQVQSAINGVTYLLERPSAGPGDAHENWRHEKVANGWSYGPVKDAEAKTHPCMVMYDDLPPEQRAKDHLFVSIVRALAPLVTGT